MVTTTLVAPLVPGMSHDGLTPSGDFIVRHEHSPFNLPTPDPFSLIAVPGGGVTPFVTLPNATTGSQPLAVWR